MRDIDIVVFHVFSHENDEDMLSFIKHLHYLKNAEQK